ncbi:MAG: M23 family metallopeptidase [Microscillaceae bacterium]|nr:M23 family metallopeptidase [Microscillaceae bacterium]MDW8461135.1 M23 family metallopeptidase [Cytophagales bacterium]
MNTKKTLSDWLNLQYLLILRSEENLEEKVKLLLTPAKVIILSFLVFVCIFTLGFFVASRVYNRSMLMGENSDVSRKIYQLSLAVDSLAELVRERDQFINNFKEVVGENRKYLTEESKLSQNDSIALRKNKVIVRNDTIPIEYMDEAERKLRREVEGNSSISSWGLGTNIATMDLKSQFFFAPIKGVITEKYNSRNAHYGIDIVAKKDEPIKTIADGTVIMATWTDETGYVIGIQHQADVVSFYKHCASLLKKTGDFVRAGEIIAIIGNSGELTTGTHLHFELWYKGVAVNPEDFITF